MSGESTHKSFGSKVEPCSLHVTPAAVLEREPVTTVHLPPCCPAVVPPTALLPTHSKIPFTPSAFQQRTSWKLVTAASLFCPAAEAPPPPVTETLQPFAWTADAGGEWIHHSLTSLFFWNKSPSHHQQRTTPSPSSPLERGGPSPGSACHPNGAAPLGPWPCSVMRGWAGARYHVFIKWALRARTTFEISQLHWERERKQQQPLFHLQSVRAKSSRQGTPSRPDSSSERKSLSL